MIIDQYSNSYTEAIVFRSVFNALSISGSLIASGLRYFTREGDYLDLQIITLSYVYHNCKSSISA